LGALREIFLSALNTSERVDVKAEDRSAEEVHQG
jgi:hypothetical protein